MTKKVYSKTIALLDVTFLNIRVPEVLTLIADAIKTNTQKSIYFINADCLNKTAKDKNYLQILNQSDYVLGDGSGVKLGCKIINEEVIDNVNGTDLLPLLCEFALKNNFSLYLLGANPGVAAKVKRNLEEQYQGIKIVGEHHGYFERNSPEEQNIIKMINESKADILLVAFGAPFQEKWIYHHRKQLSPMILMGVGGLFDFYSGNMPRAPLWLRKRGLEWTFRLYQEPKRMFKRYVIGNPLFIYKVYKWKFLKHNKNNRSYRR